MRVPGEPLAGRKQPHRGSISCCPGRQPAARGCMRRMTAVIGYSLLEPYSGTPYLPTSPPLSTSSTTFQRSRRASDRAGDLDVVHDLETAGTRPADASVTGFSEIQTSGRRDRGAQLAPSSRRCPAPAAERDFGPQQVFQMNGSGEHLSLDHEPARAPLFRREHVPTLTVVTERRLGVLA